MLSGLVPLKAEVHAISKLEYKSRVQKQSVATDVIGLKWVFLPELM